MSNYTKGPWEVNLDSKNKVVVVSPWSEKVKPINTATFGDCRGASICEMEYNSGIPTKEQAKANAKRIVQCVNNFDEVLDALKGLLACNLHENLTGGCQGQIEDAEQAIAKAKNK